MKCVKLGKKVGGAGCCAGSTPVHECTDERQESEHCTPIAIGSVSEVANVALTDGRVRQMKFVSCMKCQFRNVPGEAPPVRPSKTKDRFLEIMRSK